MDIILVGEEERCVPFGAGAFARVGSLHPSAVAGGAADHSCMGVAAVSRLLKTEGGFGSRVVCGDFRKL